MLKRVGYIKTILFMYPTTENLEYPLIKKESPSNWEIKAPLIFPESLIRTIEEILYEQRTDPDFQLVVKLLPTCPFNYFEYQEHEKSMDQLFKRILRHPYGIPFMVVSGANHYNIAENEFYPWDHFLDHVILMNENHLKCIHEGYQGLSVTHLRMVFERYNFENITDDIISAYLEHEFYEKETNDAIIPMCSVNIPLASIIQITLTPDYSIK